MLIYELFYLTNIALDVVFGATGGLLEKPPEAYII